MEIWNLVFMQFERHAGGRLEPLPRPSIDTGMGLERIACVLQDKTSNYETDLLRALVDKAASISGKRYGSGMSADDVSMRVIADHARLSAFCLAEGVMPDTNGREYVLRRVMRRAIRHGHRLGIEKPFLHEVALEVTKRMGGQYPELVAKADHIASVCEQEEVRFRRTIERGLGLLDERFATLEAEKKTTLDGADAFKLYDTYGFPLDLTEVICKERGYTVDQAGYDAALEQARERSEFKGVERAVEGVYREALSRVPSGEVAFTGYEEERRQSTLLAIVSAGQLVERLEAGAEAELIFDSTPFYGESGGQVGDTGEITSGAARFLVQDTQRPIAGLVVHQGRLASGELARGMSAELSVNSARRDAIRRNHSATHVLHWALRTVLGTHAQQKGSLVGPDRLRFDFTHPKPVSKEELTRIEDLANGEILANHAVETARLSMSEAKARGAMMLFGEKYGEEVRVLSMGDSVELCGGTHARATGDIGMLKITAEQGVAAGVRRIIATTGTGAIAYVRELEATLSRAAGLLKANPQDLPTRIEKLLQQEKALEKRLADSEKRVSQGGGGSPDQLLERTREIKGIKVLSTRTEVSDRAALRELAERLRDRLGSGVVLVGSLSDGKAQLVLTVSKALTAQLKAGELIRPIAEIVGGSGGGRPDLAQAGGTLPDKLDEALAALYKGVELGL
jgi:alanyl-tRNA synthetase